MANGRICAADGCGNPVRVKVSGLCRAHYLRARRNSGNPLGAGGKMHSAPGAALAYLNSDAFEQAGEGCLIWPFSRSTRGAAVIFLDGRQQRVARIVCERVNGPAPTPMHHAAHRCGKDHEGCVNPNHLTWKTPAENNADKLAHGTHNRGERHNLSKLSEDDVIKIYAMRGSVPASQIAVRFGVSKAAVTAIHTKRTWSWLTDGTNDA